MKRLLLLAIAVILVGPKPAFADDTQPVASVTPVTNTATGIYAHVGPFNLTVPWDNPAVCYLFDIQSKTNLVGGEAPLAQMWKFGLSAGAVTSLEGVGTPFFAINLEVPNPTPQWAAIEKLHPGVFGGYNFNTGMPIFGFKASINIFS